MKFVQLFLVAALMVFSAPTLAGDTASVELEVVVNADLSGTASGDMTTVRFSDNEFEEIGCATRHFDFGYGSEFSIALCRATDANGVRYFCQSENPLFVDAINAIVENSFVTFSWDANGQCTRMGFSTRSLYIPRRPLTPPIPE